MMLCSTNRRWQLWRGTMGAEVSRALVHCFDGYCIELPAEFTDATIYDYRSHKHALRLVALTQTDLPNEALSAWVVDQRARISGTGLAVVSEVQAFGHRS